MCILSVRMRTKATHWCIFLLVRYILFRRFGLCAAMYSKTGRKIKDISVRTTREQPRKLSENELNVERIKRKGIGRNSDHAPRFEKSTRFFRSAGEVSLKRTKTGRKYKADRKNKIGEREFTGRPRSHPWGVAFFSHRLCSSRSRM